MHKIFGISLRIIDCFTVINKKFMTEHDDTRQVGHKVWAIIPAGGIGVRMSADIPKQHLKIHGKAILHHTLSRICASPLINGVVIGISCQDVCWSKDPFNDAKILATYDAGKQRRDTVLNGLRFLAGLDDVAQSDWVLVHDAVRPCLIQQDIQNLLNEANDNQIGAVLGKKVADTLKITDENGMIMRTVEREKIWRAFTPQMFRLGDLLRAIEASVADGVQVTDESMAMERLGFRPVMVEGHFANHKITTAEDMDLAGLFLTEFQ